MHILYSMFNLKIVIFIIILFFLYQKSTVAQYPRDSIKYNETYGSAKALRGRVHIVNFFVSDDKKGWTYEDKKLVLDEQDYGNRWMQRQASLYAKEPDLTFTVSTIGLEEDVKVNHIYSSRNPTNLVTLTPWVLFWAGCQSPKNFYDSVRLADSTDNILIMIFAKKTGRSYAQHCETNDPIDARFLESAIVYSNDYDGLGLSISAIVHEMLHLFGAWDIYNSGVQTIEVERNARAILPNSIMLYKNTITKLKIDKLTAWCVGLTKNYLGWFDFFKPRLNKEDYKIIQPHYTENN